MTNDDDGMGLDNDALLQISGCQCGRRGTIMLGQKSTDHPNPILTYLAVRLHCPITICIGDHTRLGRREDAHYCIERE